MALQATTTDLVDFWRSMVQHATNTDAGEPYFHREGALSGQTRSLALSNNTGPSL